MSNFKDLTGQRFGRLLVVSRLPNKGKYVIWECLCDCGNMREVITYNLKSGITKSCGCLVKEELIKRNTKHGLCHSHIWYVHQALNERCKKSNNIGYSRYGGRGITVCDEWSGPEGFIKFVEDMGMPPSDTHQIDRIDNNKGYFPENCRWVTPTENGRNKRNNILLTLGDKTQCTSAWSEELGISGATLRARVRYGWSDEEVLTRPLRVW
jgi:hypothetical protein